MTGHDLSTAAYERSLRAVGPVGRRLDILDEPRLHYGAPRNPRGGWRPAVLPPPAWVPRGRERLEHAIAEPTITALKLGFGSAAGAGLFRFLVLAGVGVLGFVLLLAAAGGP